MNGTYTELTDRRISKATCKKYGVTAVKDVSGRVIEHYYPFHNTQTGKVEATCVRSCAEKKFRWTGNRENIGLFGQQSCKGRGKYVTITEGALDAMSVDQMFENKFDVVSLRDGGGKSAVRDVKGSLEFLEGYDNIVLCMDADDVGNQTVELLQEVFSPGKVRVVSLPKKDANAMLVNNEVRAFINAWWEAKAFRPDGVVMIEDTWDSVKEFRDTPFLNYPWQGLNDTLLGMRKKEIVVWGAPTGLGKTTAMREVIHGIIDQIPEDQKVGCLMLEEPIAKSALGWMSFAAGRPLHKELRDIPDEELRSYWDKATAGNRIALLDHQGWENNIDTLVSRIRYMRHVLGCEWIILDHLHIALSSVEGASGDWSGIDELMTRLRSLTHNLDIGLHLVAHVSGEMKFRGSQGIAQIADAAIFLDRDKHAEGRASNVTKVTVDKNRFAGEVGFSCWLEYMSDGRLHETQDAPDEYEGSEF